MLALAVVTFAGFVGLAPAAGAAVPDRDAATPAGAPPPASYRGTWYGTTSQGGKIDLIVNKKNRVVRIEFDYEVAGKECVAQVEDEVRRALEIAKKRFKVTVTTKDESFTLTGRFTSKTRASGKLAATYTDEQGCSGSVDLTWTAKKGQRPPPPANPYDGSWLGSVTFPPGLDPAILALAEATIEFQVENGAVTFMSAPWVIQGPGCFAALHGRILETLDAPVPLVKAAFSVSFSISVVGRKDWEVDGAFESPSSASGMLAMSGTSGTVGLGGCSGSLDATWTAVKQ